jgi:hypothetical protein
MSAVRKDAWPAAISTHGRRSTGRCQRIPTSSAITEENPIPLYSTRWVKVVVGVRKYATAGTPAATAYSAHARSLTA